MPRLDDTSFENGYPTTVECSTVSEKRFCNGCATCISHTISHGTTQPSIHSRLVQEIRAESVHLQKQEFFRPSVSDEIIVSTSVV
jgi:hypothetical protein